MHSTHEALHTRVVAFVEGAGYEHIHAHGSHVCVGRTRRREPDGADQPKVNCSTSQQACMHEYNAEPGE